MLVVVIGVIIPERGARPGEIANVCLVLPLLFLAAQLPVWLVRIAAGWRIVFENSEQPSRLSTSAQFGIQDMLIVTVIVAGCLGTAQAGITTMANSSQSSEVWLPLAISACACSVASALLTLPSIAAAFHSRPSHGVAMMLFYLPAISMVLFTTINVLSRAAPSEMYIAIVLSSSAAAFVLVGSFYVARVNGFRLSRRGPAQIPDAPPDKSSTE